LTVKVATRPRPLTGSVATSPDQQERHRSRGGCDRAPHARHRMIANTPCSPDVQKGSVTVESAGGMRSGPASPEAAVGSGTLDTLPRSTENIILSRMFLDRA
jgi:hypothetical protein